MNEFKNIYIFGFKVLIQGHYLQIDSKITKKKIVDHLTGFYILRIKM